jgi:hypothetical protein
VEPEFPEAEDYARGHRDVWGNGATTIAGLSPVENAALDNKLVQKERAQAANCYPYETFDEMTAEPIAKRWLLKGVFARGESSAWISAPGGMKSALMASAAIHVAAGLDWFGYRSKEAAGVVYFAIERADLVRRRITAHRRRMDLAGLPIFVVRVPIDLTTVGAFKKVVDTVRDIQERYKVSIGFVIIDTFAKLMGFGGGDENSAKDQHAIFANVQRVKDCTDTHVALIGHTGKDESRGMRGSNAALGDVDLMVTLSGDTIRTATVTKANDAPEGPLFSFASEVHDFGPDGDGDPVTVNVVSSEQQATPAATAREPKLTANQRTLFAMLHATGTAGLTLEDWNSQAREAGIGVKRKADLNDIRAALLSKRLVRQYGDRWTVQHG